MIQHNKGIDEDVLKDGEDVSSIGDWQEDKMRFQILSKGNSDTVQG